MINIKFSNLFFSVFILCILLISCQSSEEAQSSVSTTSSGSTPTPDSLVGSLIFIEQNERDQLLLWHDLETRETKTLFKADENGWIAQAIASPNGEQIVMAYAPPPPEGQIQFGYTNLYILTPFENLEPELLVERAHPEELLFNPVWSPNGRYIYYSHILPIDEELNELHFYLKRLEIETKNIEDVIENGVWPRISPNGELVAFATINPSTRKRDLFLANSDGTNVELIASSTEFIDLDAPLFSPDGKWLYFSAVTSQQSTRLMWLNKLLGVKVVSAHSVPSDWWRQPITGGEPEKLTALNEIRMYGTFSPDGRLFAFSSATGIYMMNPDGTELSLFLEVPAADSLTWVP